MDSPRNRKMQTALSAALLLIVCAAGTVSGGCSETCSCPPSPPSCPLGVSWVLDECGCCKVCAQQFNQDCGPDKPCDHIKGLRCHLGVGGDPQRGLCRADVHGRPCEFGSRMYQHGEDFQPSCEYQCTCMDGVVGCLPLCPHRLPLPSWQCSNPRLEIPLGRCCEEWVCDDDNRISENSPNSHPPHVRNNHIGKLLQVFSGSQKTRENNFQEWASLPVSRVPFLSSDCLPQTTEWSQCSASCGYGISSRLTNNNQHCKLVQETRLCQIRLCDAIPSIRKGKKCRRTVRSREPEQITFAGCSSVRRYRPRSCGTCVDGRCCRVSEARTVRMRFHCQDEESITRNVMLIQRCLCSKSYCSKDADVSSPSVSLHNDIHTFAH